MIRARIGLTTNQFEAIGRRFATLVADEISGEGQIRWACLRSRAISSATVVALPAAARKHLQKGEKSDGNPRPANAKRAARPSQPPIIPLRSQCIGHLTSKTRTCHSRVHHWNYPAGLRFPFDDDAAIRSTVSRRFTLYATGWIGIAVGATDSAGRSLAASVDAV